MLTFRSFSAAIVLTGALAIPALAQTMSGQTATARPSATGTRSAIGTMPAAGTMRTAEAAPGTAPATGTLPAARTAYAGTKGPAGTLHKVHGMWRSTTLVGATVYNNSGKAIGTIQNLLIQPQGTVSDVVLSVGGFLGIDSKLVTMPFNQIRFQPSVNNGSRHDATTNAAVVAPAPASGTAATTALNTSARPSMRRPDYSAVVPGATKATLTSMPSFSYDRRS